MRLVVGRLFVRLIVKTVGTLIVEKFSYDITHASGHIANRTMGVGVFLILAPLVHIGNVFGGCSTAEDNCPPYCLCESLLLGKLRVDCSGKKLLQTPDQLPKNTVELILKRNVLHEITSESFRNCFLLKLLDLSDNHLVKLANDSFASAATIELLNLNDNNLKYEDLPVNILGRLSKLRVCYLHNNNWKNLRSYPEDMMLGLNDLEVLTLDGFPGAYFGDQFSKLNSLNLLHIHGGLDVIYNNTFISFRNSSVTELSLKTGRALFRIYPDGFSHFKRLRTLDLGYNQALGFQNAPNAWWGLQNTEITKLVLTRIVSADMTATSVKDTFYEFLNLTRIEILLIDRNNIVELAPLLSEKLPHLVYIDTSYNRLGNIATMLRDVAFLVNVTYIDCSRQAKRYVDDGSKIPQKRSVSRMPIPSKDENTTNLRSMAAQDEDDWFSVCRTPHLVPCSFSSYKSLNTALAVGDLRSGGHPLPDFGTWCIVGPPKLETLILTESLNVDLHTLPAIVVFNTARLRRFEYRNNGIQNLMNSILFTIPSNLSIDFSDNRISCLAPEFFEFSSLLGSYVLEMYLAGNNLAQQFERDVSGITFIQFSQLHKLDLSRNSIKSMSANALRHTVHLETLDLSQNSMRTFDIQISHLSKLTFLNISYNLITTLNSTTTDKLTTMFKRTKPQANMSMDLTGNPIQCSCTTLVFLQWISSNRDHLSNFPNYSCWFNGSYVSFSHLDNTILVELNYVCSQRIAVIVSASLCALFLIVIATSVCMYRYKWEVRYWCLWLTNRSRLYRELADETDYEYDALLSYSSVDGNWVREELMPHLETPAINEVNDLMNAARPLPNLGQDIGPFRVCDRERDFPLGGDIYENIWAMMERSRKVILIITPSFARSECCDFEMNLARRACFERARNLFVPIILEEPYAADMSDGLRWIVRNLEIFTWPRENCQQEERDEFWYNLRRAVADSGLNLNFHRN